MRRIRPIAVLRALIKDRGPRAIAEKTGISDSYLYRILREEEDNPTLDYVEKILKACDTNMSAAFKEIDWPDTEEDQELTAIFTACLLDSRRATVAAVLRSLRPRD